jgi:hypothetical protein
MWKSLTVKWSWNCTSCCICCHSCFKLQDLRVDISNLRSVILTENLRRFPQLLQNKVYHSFFHSAYQFIFYKSYLAYLAYLFMFYSDVAVSSSAYFVSNDRTIINEWIMEEGYGGGRGLIWCTITVFTFLTGVTHENRFTMTSMQSEIWASDTEQVWYCDFCAYMLRCDAV